MEKPTKGLVLFLALTIFGLVGCTDPSEQELAKGKNIDIERMEGKVIAVGIGYFAGDYDYTRERMGMPYYWAKISYVKGDNTTNTEDFKGIPVEIFDRLSPGMILPENDFLSLARLVKMEGQIVEIQCDLKEDSFHFMIKDLEEVLKIYEVNKMTFCRVKDYLSMIESKLPLRLPLDISVNEYGSGEFN